MLHYDQAIKVVMETITPLPPEQVKLDTALGKVLAEKAMASLAAEK